MKTIKLYPESEKLNEVANVQSTLMQFTEWLEENDYQIERLIHGYIDGRPVGRSKPFTRVSELVYRFMGVDIKKVEIERRKMISRLPACKKKNNE